MKPYFEAGLKELARVSGYPVASVQVCGQFKRTHNFLLEAWEAFYQVMIDKYYSYLENSESDAEQQLLREIIKMLNPPTSQTTHITLDLKIKYHQLFQEFVKKQSEKNSTWKFWSQFVFKDLFCLYWSISLHSKWKLELKEWLY